MKADRRSGPAAALAAGLALAAPAMASPDAELLETCAGCHGEGGVSGVEGVPSLAGQPEYFTFDQLFLMREGVRQVEPMTDIVATLSDADIEALAEHFAAQPPELAGPEPDPALASQGAALAEARRCASCHGEGLTGQEQIPRLAKQRIDYLRDALAAYRDGTRRSADTTMSAAVRGLSDEELTALAHHAAAP